MPPIELRLVLYGPDAARALCDVVAAAKSDEPLAPVTVVVPSNHVGVTVRRLLASGRYGRVSPSGEGLAGATFLTTYRLAELLGAAALAGAGRRPVSTPVLAAAVRRVLATDPGLFAAVAEHPATESALVASYRELRDVPPSALDAIAATGRRAADVVRIHRAARAVLVDDWYDEEDLMASAVERLAASHRSGAELGAVVVHLPQRLGLHAARLLRAVAEVAPTTVIAGHTGVAAADAEVTTSLDRLGLDAESPPPVDLPVTAATTCIVTTSDADDEVRCAVRRVVDAAGGGTPLDRIAILHPGSDPYARLVHEHLEAAGIALNGASAVPLAARVAGRVLTGVLDLPQRGWTRQAVMAWLTAAPLVHEGHRLPLTEWERASRRAGVVGGRAQWDERLGDHATRREAATADAEGEADARVERLRREAGATRSLRSFVLGLLDDIERWSSEPRTWAEHSRWLRDLLDSLLGPGGRRHGWPPDAVEARAAERVELAIDRLAALDDIEDPVGLDVVTRTLVVELESDLGRVGRFGEGVLVGTITMGVGLDLDLVVVVGQAEGLSPTPTRDDSLLPDRERRAAGGALGLRRDGVGRQHRELLAALSAGAEQVLSFPRGDLRRRNERVPSRWLLAVASELAGHSVWAADLAEVDAGWVHHVGSFDHGLRTLTAPATAQEHRLRSLLASGAAPRSMGPVRALGDGVLLAGAELLQGRSSRSLTRYDGNLAELAVGSPADPNGSEVASATRLEGWARCPFDYFLRHVLGVQEVDNPEDADVITPTDRGHLVHDVLEQFLKEVLDRSTAPAPHDRWTSGDRDRVRELAAEAFARYHARGLTGRRLFWNRDRPRILSDLDDILTFDEEMRQVNRSRPMAAELAFGGAQDRIDVVALPLPDGRFVRFKGKADRIDRTDDGGLLVIDYKTGSDRSYEGLGEADPDQGGTRLQLAVYGAAARAAEGRADAPVRSEYWFVSSRYGFKPKGYPLTPAVEQRISETLGLIVDGIEAGAFPSRPAEGDGAPFNPCWSCDPDFLGVGDLRRAWDAKADDAALVGYRTLIDPERRVGGDGDGDGDGARGGDGDG